MSRVRPHHKDYSALHTFGAVGFDPKGLPENFSVYEGQEIPNQNAIDTRFSPAVRPLPLGCTAEAQTFGALLQDGVLYPPDDLYFATPPGTDGTGRDLRAALQTTVDYGFKLPDGRIGAKREAYLNVYGAGKIDDFDATRTMIYLNFPIEKRVVSVGSFWYREFQEAANGTRVVKKQDGTYTKQDGTYTLEPGPRSPILPVPSFNTREAVALHNWLVTGWKTIDGVVYAEVLAWEGEGYGDAGIVYMSREIFNALMQQPYTAAFVMTKLKGQTPVPLGLQVYVDHFVYWFKSLYPSLFGQLV